MKHVYGTMSTPKYNCSILGSTVAYLAALWRYAGEQIDEWAAEGGVAPPIAPGTTALLDDVLHVDVQTFCHRFLADRVCTPPLLWVNTMYLTAGMYLPHLG